MSKARPRSAPPSRWASLPYALRYGVPLLVLALAVALWVRSLPAPPQVTVIGPGGEPVGPGTLELFELDESLTAPSPPRRLGEIAFASGHEVAVPLPPPAAEERVLARVKVRGFGASYCVVDPAREKPVVCPTAPPVARPGRIVPPEGIPAADAHVLAFGGGPHGVLLATATTDQAGRFELEGLAASLGSVHVRVLAAGCAVAAATAWLVPEVPLVLELEATELTTGRVVLPSKLEPAGLRVRAGVRLLAQAPAAEPASESAPERGPELSIGGAVFEVPGLEAPLDPRGAFALDHLPLDVTSRLVVAGLPPGWTHGVIRAQGGQQDIAIEVARSARVEGLVYDPRTGQGRPFATVVHEYGPHGGEAVRADELGRFAIGYLPPGRVVLRAFTAGINPRSGSRALVLREGEVRTGFRLDVP